MLSTDPSKMSPKYKCMVSGKARMEPCSGCPNTKGCMSRAMQYKENEEMDMEEKAVVKIGTDGVPVKCAKGADLAECGYKAGAKVCGKCGAMAVQMKEDMEDDELMSNEEMDSVEDATKPAPKKKPAALMTPEDEAEDSEEIMEEEGEDKFMNDDPLDEEHIPGSGKKMMADDPTEERKRLRQAGRVRMQQMGKKSADYDEGGFLCGYSREIKSAGSSICASCPGGCQPEEDLPTLIEIEGIAADTFEGKVTDSGYSTDHDVFLVAMDRKSDGEGIVVMFDGSTAECVGWRKKELGFTEVEVIGFNDAKEIAMKSIDGEFVDVETDVYNGQDAYVVNIKTGESEATDVYVGLGGEILAVDTLDYAEAAEIALKRMYGEEQRSTMAEEGTALPDGSYPIKDTEDLRNAIMAYGRAKDKAAAKAHIMKRAKDLDAEDMIPESWTQKSGEEAAFLADLMEFEVLAAEEDI